MNCVPVRKGFPPNLTVFLQEYGQLLRGVDMTTADNANGTGLYFVWVNVATYLQLVWRTKTAEKATRDEKDRNLKDHIEVLKLFVLDKECFHAGLEHRFGHPDSSDRLSEPCGNMRPMFTGERKQFQIPFSVVKIQQSIAEVFHNESRINLINFPNLLKKAS